MVLYSRSSDRDGLRNERNELNNFRTSRASKLADNGAAIRVGADSGNKFGKLFLWWCKNGIWHTVGVCHDKEVWLQGHSDLSSKTNTDSLTSALLNFQNGFHCFLNYLYLFKGSICDGPIATFLVIYSDCLPNSMLLSSKAQSHNLLAVLTRQADYVFNNDWNIFFSHWTSLCWDTARHLHAHWQPALPIFDLHAGCTVHVLHSPLAGLCDRNHEIWHVSVHLKILVYVFSVMSSLMALWNRSHL